MENYMFVFSTFEWVLRQLWNLASFLPFPPSKWLGCEKKKKYLHGKEWSYSKNKNSSENCMKNCTTWEHAKVQILNLIKIRIPLTPARKAGNICVSTLCPKSCTWCLSEAIFYQNRQLPFDRFLDYGLVGARTFMSRRYNRICHLGAATGCTHRNPSFLFG